jgi:hypothetical protein
MRTMLSWVKRIDFKVPASPRPAALREYATKQGFVAKPEKPVLSF